MPERFIVIHFYGSAVINLISSDSICCVFPRATVGKYLMQVMRVHELLESEVQAMSKYEGRGFNCVGWNDLDRSENEFSKMRRVGDRMCWNVPWGVRQMPKRREIDDDDVERSRFMMGKYRTELLQR